MENYIVILEYALQMELDGYNFFKTKAKESSDLKVKLLFEELSLMEKEHYSFIKAQIDYYYENNALKKLDVFSLLDKEKSIYKKIEEEIISYDNKENEAIDINVIRTAYLIEEDYARFYREYSKKVSNQEAKELFETLAIWEEAHASIFKDEYDKRMTKYIMS